MLPALRPKKLHAYITDLIQLNNVSFVELPATSTGVYQRLNPRSTLVKQLKTRCLDSDRYTDHTHGFGKKKSDDHEITQTVLNPKSAIGQFSNNVTTRWAVAHLLD
ncbi:hypothetical protein D3C85_1549740 [compost metagenome]